MAQQYVDFTWVKSEADFSAVLSHYKITFPPGREQLKVRCPFHSEAEPSLSVNLPEKKFKCFGCNAQGSILDFVVGIEGSNLRAAAIKLAEICGCGLAPPKGAGENRGRKKAKEGPDKAQSADDEKKRASEAPTEPASVVPSKALALTQDEIDRISKIGTPEAEGWVWDRAQEHQGVATAALPRSPVRERRSAPRSEGVNPPLGVTLTLDPKHPYLAGRGLAPETVAEFGLGYCGRGLMRGRIAIPIHDADGNLVAYAGRWPGDEGWPEGEGKYKLPKGFEKSAVLFNLHRVLRSRRFAESDAVILVEGFFSVFWITQLECVGNVVALMGRELSERQEALLCEHFSRVTLLLDGDVPGREATATLLPRLARRVHVKAPVMPEGRSPDGLPFNELEELL